MGSPDNLSQMSTFRDQTSSACKCVGNYAFTVSCRMRYNGGLRRRPGDRGVGRMSMTKPSRALFRDTLTLVVESFSGGKDRK